MTENSNSQSSITNSITEIEIESYYSVSDASETVKGIVKLVTTEESIEGIDDTKAITPLKLKETLETQPKPEWSQITGDLKDQTDLSNALSSLGTSIDDLNTAKADNSSVEAIQTNLEASVNSLEETKADKSEIPTKVSQLQNDSGYLTEHQDISNLATKEELTTVEQELNTELNTKANQATTLAGYGITNAYTKSEVDAKVSSMYRFKGNVENYDSLPSDNVVVGDTYNITDTGANYFWTGTAWDKLSETVDLTPYALKTDVPTNVSQLTNDKEYLTSVPDEYVTDTELTTGLNTKQDKGDYALKSEIPDTTNLATKTELSSKQDSSTAVTHAANTTVGSSTYPVYINAEGEATMCNFPINSLSTAAITDTKLFLAGGDSQGTYVTGRSNVNNFIDTDNTLNTVTAPATLNFTDVPANVEVYVDSIKLNGMTTKYVSPSANCTYYDLENNAVYFETVSGITEDATISVPVEFPATYNKVSLEIGVSGLSVSFIVNGIEFKSTEESGIYSINIANNAIIEYQIAGGDEYSDASGSITVNGEDITETITMTPATWSTFTRPNLTSKGTLGGSSFAVCSPDTYNTSSMYAPYRAVDSSTSTSYYWRSTSGTSEKSYILYNPNPLKVSKFIVSFYSSGISYIARDITIYGSNDNISYDVIATDTFTSAASSRALNIEPTKGYTYYKIGFIPNISTTTLSITNIAITATVKA